MKSGRSLFILLVVILGTAPAGAAVVARYEAVAGGPETAGEVRSPLESGFTAYASGAGDIQEGVLDGGTAAWRVYDASSQNPGFFQYLSPSAYQAMYFNGWTFKAVVKAAAGTTGGTVGLALWSVDDSTAPAGWNITGANGAMNGFSVRRINGDELEVQLWQTGAGFQLGPGSANTFHSLEMRGTAYSDTFDVYIDNVLQLPGVALNSGPGFGGQFADRVLCNSGSSGGTGGDAWWNELSLTTSTSTDVVDVYILTGQSNALGTTALEGVETDPGTDPADAFTSFFWANVAGGTGSNITYPPATSSDSGGVISTLQVQGGEGANLTFWGPEFGLARALYDLARRPVLIIKTAKGGGRNLYWDKDTFDMDPDTGHMWGHTRDAVDIALAELIATGIPFRVRGVLYLQGESNTADDAAVAGPRLEDLFDHLKAHVQAAYPGTAFRMELVIAEIAASQGSSSRILTTSQQQALAASRPDIRFFTTRDLPLKSDNIHFGKDAKLEIGRRYAEAFLGLQDRTTEVIWQNDWKTLGPIANSGTVNLTDSNLDGGPGVATLVGTQDLTIVSGSPRAFNSASVGGYDLIENGSAALFELAIELTDVPYEAGTEYQLHFVIGSGSSNNRNGNWFVEFGTWDSGTGTFTPLPGVDSGASSYGSGPITLTTAENFQDNTNNRVEPFGDLHGTGTYHVGGRLVTLSFVPNEGVTGETIAFRWGVTSSGLFSGFTDMQLVKTTGGLGVPVDGSGVNSTDGAADFYMNWDSAPGLRYRVLSTPDAVHADWTEKASGLAATPPFNTFHIAAPALDHELLRVERE